MAIACPVKYIHEAMRGAPVLSGTAGTLAALLDTFLVTGWGGTTALSVSVAGGVGTATLTPGENFEAGAVVLLSGATPAALNGEARVLSSSAGGITFATDAPDGAASGTITIKYAPVGQWEHAFAPSGHKRVYRSTDVTGPRFYYRLDDAGTTTARLRGFESMTDIDSGVGAFPTEVQLSGGGYIAKAQNAAATPVQYTLQADSRFVIIAIAAGSQSNATYRGAHTRGFGDLIALAGAGDAWAACVAVGASDVLSNAASSPTGSVDREYGGGPGGIYLPRAHSGLGAAVKASGCRAESGGASSTTSTSGADPHFGATPNSVTGDLLVSRRFVLAHDNAAPRAVVPGLLHIPQAGALAALGHRGVVPGAGTMAGRTLMSVAQAYLILGIAPEGCGLIDVTGPWR